MRIPASRATAGIRRGTHRPFDRRRHTPRRAGIQYSGEYAGRIKRANLADCLSHCIAVIAGLVPAIHVSNNSVSNDFVVQINPLGIVGQNQPYFPFSRPMLDVVFALDRSLNVLVVFEINEPLDLILFRKSCDLAIPMFVNSSDKVVRNTDVQDAVGRACQYVKIATCHCHNMKNVDGRDKPGHDDGQPGTFTPLPACSDVPQVSIFTYSKSPGLLSIPTLGGEIHGA